MYWWRYPRTIDEHDTVSLEQLLFRILVFYALRDEHEQGRISGALRLPLPLLAELNLNDGIFCRFTNFSQNIKI